MNGAWVSRMLKGSPDDESGDPGRLGWIRHRVAGEWPEWDLPLPPAWMRYAACNGSTLDFFARGRHQRAPALALCGTCSVADDCLDYALTHDMRDGVWGGLTPPERRFRSVPAAEVGDSFIYFAADDAFSVVKIGCSSDVERRVRSLGLTLLATEPGHWARERTLHRLFAHLRVHGEFFRAAPDLLAYIDGLCEDAA